MGQYPEGTPEEALAFFTRRFERWPSRCSCSSSGSAAGGCPPTRRPSPSTRSPPSWSSRTRSATSPPWSPASTRSSRSIGLQRDQRREERARRLEEARERKRAIAAEAEKIAAGRDWRNGANRLRDLLAEWKALPRLDKAADDELWHRFSGARTAYTRARKAHFAEMNEQSRRRPGGQGAPGQGGRGARRLDRLGPDRRPLPRPDAGVEGRRAGAQGRRRRAVEALPRGAGRLLRRPRRRERRARQGVRRQRRGQAGAARRGRGAAAGHRPRRGQAGLPRHLREVGRRRQGARATRSSRSRRGSARSSRRSAVEDDQWRRWDPEKSARADDMVGQLARRDRQARGRPGAGPRRRRRQRAKRLEDDLASRRAFLEMAEKTAAEFG